MSNVWVVAKLEYSIIYLDFRPRGWLDFIKASDVTP
jgi:hypothetical protein